MKIVPNVQYESWYIYLQVLLTVKDMYPIASLGCFYCVYNNILITSTIFSWPHPSPQDLRSSAFLHMF
jgi:hypothetical protein